jgi:hypothetical protein
LYALSAEQVRALDERAGFRQAAHDLVSCAGQGVRLDQLIAPPRTIGRWYASTGIPVLDFTLCGEQPNAARRDAFDQAGELSVP